MSGSSEVGGNGQGTKLGGGGVGFHFVTELKVVRGRERSGHRRALGEARETPGAEARQWLRYFPGEEDEHGVQRYTK